MEQTFGLEQFFLCYGCGRARSRLVSCGLTGKKLVVFQTNDADDIASQVCRDLGIILKQTHVGLAAEWIEMRNAWSRNGCVETMLKILCIFRQERCYGT